MNDKKSINKSSIKVTRNFIIAIISILVILFLWAGLTKAGYIKNYLGIEILCPETELIKPQETSSWKVPISLDTFSMLQLILPAI